MYANLFNRIIVDSTKFNGQPYLHRTHFTVAEILRMMADGMTQDDLLAYYPPLTPLDIRAVLAYAASSIEKSKGEVAISPPATPAFNN